MIHRGEVVIKAIRASKKSISDVAKHIGVDRSTIYNWADVADLSVEKIIEIGKYIGYDFRQEFPKLLGFSQSNIKNEDAESTTLKVQIQTLEDTIRSKDQTIAAMEITIQTMQMLHDNKNIPKMKYKKKDDKVVKQHKG